MDTVNLSPTVKFVVLFLVLAVGVYAVDLQYPSGVSVSTLYVALVLITLGSSRRAFTINVALVCSGLTLLGLFSYHIAGGDHWMSFINRVIAIIAIWITAFLILLHKEAKEQIKTLQGLLPVCPTCKKIRDNKGTWSAVDQYLKQHPDIQVSQNVCPDCLKKFLAVTPA